MSKIVCVVPTIRPDRMAEFKTAWEPLFRKHGVTLITVWDGDRPEVECSDDSAGRYPADALLDDPSQKQLFYRYTDSVRNYGFVAAAKRKPDYVLTLDDDCLPRVYEHDPIRAHVDTLNRRCSLHWMNTAQGDLYLRGVPYGCRADSPVMLSHGVWVGTPDFDGETQLGLENNGGVPRNLNYYNGPVPYGTLFPLCGMNVMVRREALPYLYYAPMGPDTGIPGLNRFGDIWMGMMIKRLFDGRGWACWTGASFVLHSRASDAKKNEEQERLGRAWNEVMWRTTVRREDPVFTDYMIKYTDNTRAYRDLITLNLNR
jgi:hypothetical protein